MMKPRPNPNRLVRSGESRCPVCRSWYVPRYSYVVGTLLENPTGCPHCAMRRGEIPPRRRSS